MKTNLLFLLFAGLISVNAQTTHDLNWERDMGPNVDVTIEAGDTVRWTWIDNNHTVENDPAGTSVETFNSGFIGAAGSTYSFTFTNIGTNDYYCSVHGAASMSGTITVEPALSVDEFNAVNNSFSLSPNPVSSNLILKLPNSFKSGTIAFYDMLGRQIISIASNDNSPINLDVSDFNKGIYLIKVKSNNVEQTKRLIIK